MIPNDIHRRLPKSSLFSVEWSWRHFYFASFRLANARRFQIGWLVILVRAPWLEASARALHPQMFRGQQ